MTVGLRRSPYWPVFTDPVLKRVIPGVCLSDLGNAMSLVAISWLAIELAPPGRQALWVSVALAANALPAIAGVVLFGRWMNGRSGAQLAQWEATLRALCLGAVPIAYYTHLLTLPLLVVLLTVSASLAAWGDAGRFLVFTDSLPEEHHITANAVSTTAQELSTILGPLTAAVLIGWIGPAGTVGVDAATCAVLASIYRSAAPRTGRIQQPVAGGFAIIWRKPRLVGLMALTIGYYVLYGPVLVALPVLVSTDLHESVATLALCYSVFGFGSVAGIVVVPFLRAVPVWSVMIGSVLLFGLSLVPMGIGAPMGVALVAFAFGGLVWAPYVPVLTAVFQKEASPAVMAARGAFGMASTPLGTLVGGPVVAVLGARATLLGSGVATMALGVTAAIVVLAKRVRATNGVAAND